MDIVLSLLYQVFSFAVLDVKGSILNKNVLRENSCIIEYSKITPNYSPVNESPLLINVETYYLYFISLS